MPLPLIKEWWKLSENLESVCYQVLPNRARSSRDAATGAWTRAPGHFLLKLHFAALVVQEGLKGQVGKALSVAQRAVREAGGQPRTNLFVNRTPQELENAKGKARMAKGKMGKDRKAKGAEKARKGRVAKATLPSSVSPAVRKRFARVSPFSSHQDRALTGECQQRNTTMQR